MKKKTIERTLKKVHQDWVKSINDKVVRKLVERNTIITGGAIASMLMGEDVNDYDIYFRDADTVTKVLEYYLHVTKSVATELKQTLPPMHIEWQGEAFDSGKHKVGPDDVLDRKVERVYLFIKSAGLIKFPYLNKKVFKKNQYKPIFLTGNAVTLTDKIQLITRFFGEPEDIHSNYDFEHCKSYWCSWTGKLVINPNSAEAILARELRYTGSKYPLSSIIRTRKFIRKGWQIQAGEFVKMAVQLNDLDLLDVKVLEDQLIGVDTTYFQMFINQIRTDMEKEDFKLTATYVCDVIDKIFHESDEEDQFDNPDEQ